MEYDEALNAASRARDMLKGELIGMGDKVARAREEAIQEYKDNLKDMDDYLDLMRDAVEEYKMAVKKVDLSFEVDYYDNLILGEPQTPAPEDPVRFEKLDPIGTPRADAEQSTVPPAEPLVDNLVQPPPGAKSNQPSSQPAQPTTDQPAAPSANS